MSDLEDFIKSYENKLSPGKRSVLEPYKDEILKMKQLGFTEKLILQFLAEKKNVSVSQQALNRFIRSRLQKMNLGAEKMVEKSQNDNKLINSKALFLNLKSKKKLWLNPLPERTNLIGKIRLTRKTTNEKAV